MTQLNSILYRASTWLEVALEQLSDAGYRVEFPVRTGTGTSTVRVQAIKGGQLWEASATSPLTLDDALADLTRMVLSPPPPTKFPANLSNMGWQLEFQRYGGIIYRGNAIAQFPDGRWWTWNGWTLATSRTKEDAKAAVDIAKANKQAFSRFHLRRTPTRSHQQ